jgi:hypothetical protein
MGPPDSKNNCPYIDIVWQKEGILVSNAVFRLLGKLEAIIKNKFVLNPPAKTRQ